MKRATHSLKMACPHSSQAKKAKEHDQTNLTTLTNIPLYTTPPPLLSVVTSPPPSTFPKSPMSPNVIVTYNTPPPPPSPAVLPKTPLSSHEMKMNPLALPPSRSTFVGHDSKIKVIIEALRIMPDCIDLNTLTFVNVLDQWYNGFSTPDNGTWISVTFRPNVNPRFREMFLDCTISSK